MTREEAIAGVLLALARIGVPPDVQEMLVRGDGRGTIPPRALLTALTAAGWQHVSEGYVVVPKEATPAMLSAAWQAIRVRRPYGQILGPGPGFDEAFRAMIEAEIVP